MEEIKLNLENLSDSEREQLMALVKKANKPKSKAWMPSKGEIYYFITSYGVIYCDYFDINRFEDKEMLELGNCFRTRKEAEEAVTRQKIFTKWKRLSIEAGEEENDWSETSQHWYVYCNSAAAGILCYGYVSALRYESIYFPTKEACMNAVQGLGEENVKKYILNIKDEYN